MRRAAPSERAISAAPAAEGRPLAMRGTAARAHPLRLGLGARGAREPRPRRGAVAMLGLLECRPQPAGAHARARALRARELLERAPRLAPEARGDRRLGERQAALEVRRAKGCQALHAHHALQRLGLPAEREILRCERRVRQALPRALDHALGAPALAALSEEPRCGEGCGY